MIDAVTVFMWLQVAGEVLAGLFIIGMIIGWIILWWRDKK